MLIGNNEQATVAYRLTDSNDSYDLTSVNCATTTIQAIKDAIGDPSVEVNSTTIENLLGSIAPIQVQIILKKDFKNYEGRGLVKSVVV